MDAWRQSQLDEGKKKIRADMEANGELDGLTEQQIDDKIAGSAQYKEVDKEYGVGSDFWRNGTALTGLLAGALGGNVTGGMAAGAAPYVAGLIKSVAGGHESARIALHTLASAVLVQLQGGNAAAGAAGGFIASSGSEALSLAFYNKEPDKLSPDEKTVIVNLVAALGAAGGSVAAGNSSGTGSGANAARVEVENNYLSSTEKSRQTELNNKKTLTPQEQQERDALNRKDLESDLAYLQACQGRGGDCESEKGKAREALNTYINQTYLNPKEAQAGYQQIQALLNSTDPNAKEVFNILEGYTQAFMTFGYSEDEAKSRASAYVGVMYVSGGVSAVVASGALVKQFGKDVATKTSQITKNSDGFYEVNINSTPLEGQERLNTLDITGNGKRDPADAAAAARLETVLGKLERAPETGGKNAGFIITSGPNAGKTVDLMYTTKNLNQKEIDGINKFYEKNMTVPKVAGGIPDGQKQIIDHLSKADVVPVDFSVLNTRNQNVFMDFVKTLPKSQQDKIIIMR
ncbi:VENN motif pre-toxin domain-containing protein [Phytobacter ursingii]